MKRKAFDWSEREDRRERETLAVDFSTTRCELIASRDTSWLNL